MRGRGLVDIEEWISECGGGAWLDRNGECVGHSEVCGPAVWLK